MSKSDVRKNVKRLFAMFLALAMVLTLLPAAVMADAAPGNTGEALTDDHPAPPAIETETNMPVAGMTANTVEGGVFAPFADDDGILPDTFDEDNATVGQKGDVLLNLQGTDGANTNIEWMKDLGANNGEDHRYQIAAVGGGNTFTFVLEGDKIPRSIFTKPAATGSTWTQQTGPGVATNTLSLQNGDRVLFLDDASNYAVVMFIQSATVKLNIEGDNTADTAATLKDALSFKISKAMNYPADEPAGTIYVVIGAVGDEDVTAGKTWFDGKIFDVNGAIQDGGAKWTGDELTFTVTPGTNRRAVVTFDTGTLTNQSKTIVNGGTDSTFVVDLTQTKRYNITVKYELTDLTVTGVEATVPADTYVYVYGPEGINQANQNYEVYYTKNAVSADGKKGTLKLTFGGAAKGDITVAENNTKYIVTDNKDDTVTVYGAALDYERIVFNRGGGQIKVGFFEVARVNLSVTGVAGSGTVTRKIVQSANGSVAPEFDQGVSLPGESESWAFDRAGRGMINEGDDISDDKGDEIELTIAPKTVGTTVYEVAEVNVTQNNKSVNLVTPKPDDGDTAPFGSLEDGATTGSYIYTLRTTEAVVTSINIEFKAMTPLTGVTVDGRFEVGQTLTAVPAGSAKSYQWFTSEDDKLDTADDNKVIENETSATLKLTDTQFDLFVYVTAKDSAGTSKSSTPQEVRAPAFTIASYRAEDADNTVFTPAENPAAGAVALTVNFIKNKVLDDSAKDNTVTLTFTAGGGTEAITHETNPADGGVSATADNEDPNSYTIVGYSDGDTVTFTRQSAKYVVRFAEKAKLTLNTALHGKVSYAITALNNANNVEVTPVSAESTMQRFNGDTLALTLVPDPGYTVGTVTYGDDPASTEIELNDVTGLYEQKLTKGNIYDVKVTFVVATPDTEPDGADAKAEGGTLTLTAAYNEGAATEIVAIDEEDIATASAVAYSMYTAGGLTNLAFPNSAGGTPVMYMIANNDEWGEVQTYEGSIPTVADDAIIIFFTDADNWVKVKVEARALAKISVVGADPAQSDVVAISYVINSATGIPGKLDGNKTRQWMDSGASGYSVELNVTRGGAVTPAAFVTVNGAKQPADSTTVTKYEATISADTVYNIVVTFADVLDPEDQSIEGVYQVEDGTAITGTQIVGNVDFLIPDGSTLDITGTVDRGITVSGGGTVAAGAVSADAAGQPVGVMASTLNVEQLTVSAGNTLTIEGSDGAVTVSEAFTLDGAGTNAAVNIGTLTLGGMATHAISNGATLTVSGTAGGAAPKDGTLEVKADLTVGAGSTLSAVNGGKITVDAGKALTINGLLNLSGNDALTLNNGSRLIVGTGRMILAPDVIKLATSDAAELIIGVPAARTLGTMAVSDTEPSVLFVTETLSLPGTLAITINAGGKLVVGKEVTADSPNPEDAGYTFTTLTANGRFSGAGDVILMPGSVLKARQAAGMNIIAENGLKLNVGADKMTYTARWIIDIEVTAAAGGLGGKRDLTLTRLEKGDYIVVQTESLINTQKYVYITTEEKTDEAKIKTMKIDYSGTPQRILVIVYSGNPNLTGEVNLGVAGLAMNDTYDTVE